MMDVEKNTIIFTESTISLFKNASELIFHGNRNVRIMTQSLLSTSFDRISLVENLQKQTERYIGSSSYNMVKRKAFTLLCEKLLRY